MKHLILCILLAATAAGQSTGDYLLQRKTATGYEPKIITPESGKVLSWDGSGNPTNITPVTSLTWEAISGKPSTFAPIIGSGANDAVAGNDSRLTNARTPTAHKSSHATGGNDALTPGDIGAATAAQGTLADTALQPADILTGGGTITPKSSGNLDFNNLGGGGTWGSITGDIADQTDLGTAATYDAGQISEELNRAGKFIIARPTSQSAVPITICNTGDSLGAMLTGSTKNGIENLSWRAGTKTLVYYGGSGTSAYGSVLDPSIGWGHQITAGGSSFYSNTGGDSGHLQANRLSIAYLKYNGGGVITLEYSLDGGTAWLAAGAGTGKTFTADSGTDVFTSTAHGFSQGTGVWVASSGGTLPTATGGNLAESTPYWVIYVDANSYKLARTPALASTSTAIDLTGNGSGTMTATPYSSLAIETQNATTAGAYVEYTLSGASTAKPCEVRVRNLSGFTVRINSVGAWWTGDGGVVTMHWNVGGTPPDFFGSMPLAVIGPWFEGMAPDVLTTRWDDPVLVSENINDVWGPGGSWDTFYDLLKSTSHTSWDVLVFGHGPNDDGTDSDAINAAQREWARTTNNGYFDTRYALAPNGDITTANALGFQNDLKHQNDLGYAKINASVLGLWGAAQSMARDFGGLRGRQFNGAYASFIPYGPSAQGWHSIGNIRTSGIYSWLSIGRDTSAASETDFTGDIRLRNDAGALKIGTVNSTNYDLTSTSIVMSISNPYEVYADNTLLNYKLGTISKPWGSVATKALYLENVAKTTTYTATVVDHTIVCDATSGAFTVNLPNSASVDGIVYVIKKIDAANTVTVDPNGTQTIDGATTSDLTSQWQTLRIQSDGANWITW